MLTTPTPSEVELVSLQILGRLYALETGLCLFLVYFLNASQQKIRGSRSLQNELTKNAILNVLSPR
jgi:hypothetical protein